MKRYKAQQQSRHELKMRQKQEQMRANEIDLDQDEVDDFDTVLGNQEKQIMANL